MQTMMRRALSGFVLALTCGAAVAAAEWTSRSKPGDGSVFDFRGNIIGDPISRMQTFYWDQQSNVSQCYSDRSLPGYKTCRDTSIEGLVGQSKILDLPVKHLFYEYLDDKLIGFLLTASADVHAGLRDMVVRLYGPPHKEEPSAVQTRGGATFDQLISVWNTPHGPMTLTKRARKAGESELRLLDATAKAKLIAISRRNAREAIRPSE